MDLEPALAGIGQRQGKARTPVLLLNQNYEPLILPGSAGRVAEVRSYRLGRLLLGALLATASSSSIGTSVQPPSSRRTVTVCFSG